MEKIGEEKDKRNELRRKNGEERKEKEERIVMSHYLIQLALTIFISSSLSPNLFQQTVQPQ